MIDIFNNLIIEINSLCNRTCPTCLRQTDPTMSRWNEDGTPKIIKLPDKIVYSVIDQAVEMGYKRWVYFYFYSEPLLDWQRFFKFIRYAKNRGLQPYLYTNGDILTPDNPDTTKIAKLIDELIVGFVIDRYYITMDHIPTAKAIARTKYLEGLFKRKLSWESANLLYGEHMTNHHSPRKQELENLTKLRQNWPSPCYLTPRMIIDYKGEMLLCCEDIMGNWDLGNIHDSSLTELWHSPKHQKIVKTLAEFGGRLKYDYCSICPLKGGTEATKVNW